MPSEAPAVTIRPAVIADAPAITTIYNAGIGERIATFETRLRTVAEIEERIARLPAQHAMLVAERAGRVVGVAWYGAYSDRECYCGIGEYSVYVSQEARGGGIGLWLVEALIDAARTRGVWKLTSRIFPENEPSLRIADRAGFRRVGIHERHARLDGEWRAVVVVERLIEENLR